jgi:tRNA (guanine-N(7)-)-methyltransferase subunit TRM82
MNTLELLEYAHQAPITAVCFHPTFGYYFATADDNKLIKIWNIRDGIVEKEKHSIKRITCMTFTKDNELLVADKFGNVLSFPMDQTAEGRLLLGHLSLISDMLIGDAYLITADRDEKIRISRLNAPYVIESFCLGHVQFVSKLSWLDRSGLLVSGGGDMNLMVWEVISGTCLTSMNMGETLGESDQVSAISALGCLDPFIVCVAEK